MLVHFSKVSIWMSCATLPWTSLATGKAFAPGLLRL